VKRITELLLVGQTHKALRHTNNGVMLTAGVALNDYCGIPEANFFYAINNGISLSVDGTSYVLCHIIVAASF